MPQEVIDNTQIPDTFVAPIAKAPVVLVVSVDLTIVAAVDQDLDRVGIAGGASVYPLVWNILLAASAPERVLAATLDVTEPAQVSSAVQQARDRFAQIDVLVNNAGYGYRAAIEEGDDADVHALFETHFFGTVAMIKAVLPNMRARRSGAIVNISSIGAQLTPVGSGYYSAAKASIEGMSGALRGELAPLGISVTVVEPGAFRTDFAGRSLVQSAIAIDDYAATAGRRRDHRDKPPQACDQRKRVVATRRANTRWRRPGAGVADVARRSAERRSHPHAASQENRFANLEKTVLQSRETNYDRW